MVDAIEFKRKPKEVELDKETLEKYEGDYDLGGQVAKFYLKEGNENTLFLFVAGQPEYELLSLGQHRFALKIADGYTVEFKEDSNGKFQQAVFVQPNGTFKAERK